MNLFAVMMELHTQTTKKTDWTSFIYRCIPGALSWVVIVLYFMGAINRNIGAVDWFAALLTSNGDGRGVLPPDGDRVLRVHSGG